jgi:putative membrane protein
MSYTVRLRVTSVVLGLVVAGALNAQSAPSPRPAERTSTHATTGATPSGELRQRQALGVLAAINQAEVNAAQLALARGQNSATRQYAQTMIQEHTQNQRALEAWQPDKRSAPAQAKAAEAQAEAATLARQQGAAFDAAYLSAMVTDHRKALDTLDTLIIPAATQADLRTFLKETRAHVADHLARAERLAGNATAAD